MFKLTLLFLFLMQFSAFGFAEEGDSLQQTDIYFEDNILYCDVRTFDQEAYILKVLAGGSPLTVSWQFVVEEEQPFWLNDTVATVELGRQIIPDLVIKRWLMRDLNVGVVRYTTDVHAAMLFLTEMRHVAVLDASLLSADGLYVLETKIYMEEGEAQVDGWSSWINWGDDVGAVDFAFEQGKATVYEK